MDLLDVITGILTISVVVAALPFPINRRNGDETDPSIAIEQTGAQNKSDK